MTAKLKKYTGEKPECNKKDRWDSGKPCLPTKYQCDIQINVKYILLGNIFTTYCSSITQYVNDLDFDLSSSLKVKYDGAIEHPIYGFPLLFNTNIWPNSLLYGI